MLFDEWSEQKGSKAQEAKTSWGGAIALFKGNLDQDGIKRYG